MEIICVHIKDGIVVNLSAGDMDKPWKPPEGIEIVEFEKAQDNCVIGSTWDGKVFTLPTPPEPVLPEPTLQEKLDAALADITKLEDDMTKVQKDVVDLKTK
jgi:hypothetical protein